MLFLWPRKDRRSCRNKGATTRGRASQAACFRLKKDCARPAVGHFLTILVPSRKVPPSFSCCPPNPREGATCDRNERLLWLTNRDLLVAIHRCRFQMCSGFPIVAFPAMSSFSDNLTLRTDRKVRCWDNRRSCAMPQKPSSPWTGR